MPKRIRAPTGGRKQQKRNQDMPLGDGLY